MKTAREKAQEDVKQIIQQAKENASDKSLANAFALEMRVRQAQSDPNLLPAVRKEAETLAAAFPDSDRIHAIVATSYELHGAMDRRQELNLAIQNIEKALSIASDKKVSHAMRLASLLYRTGSFYGEKNLTLRAIKEAEQALTKSESAVLPGPREGAARQNRLMIQIFLAKCYTEQTLLARESQDAAGEKEYLAKTKNTVSSITQALGETTLWPDNGKACSFLPKDKPTMAFRCPV